MGARFPPDGILGVGMVQAKVLVVLWAVLLLGPLMDPHAADPYHTHFVLEGGSAAAASAVWTRPGQPAPRQHPPGVVWLRAADPAGATVVHGGTLLPAAESGAPVPLPGHAGTVAASPSPAYRSVALAPEPPPPRPS
jgi:hypothetical protein